MNTRAAAPFELRGVHVLAGLIFCFGLVIAVNVAFAFMAVKTFPGEDEQHSYVQGLHYNHTLAERHMQAALGWRAGAALDQGPHGGELQVRLIDADEAPIDSAVVTGELERPTDSRLDRALSFAPRGDGVYIARTDNLPLGEWRLRARAQRSDGALDFERSFTWRGSTSH
ncbi:MAG TPA: FixH family protein [Caulobacterales bacterium]|nr:FixH family protein [Caulobacterales bacterium]